MLLVVTGTAVDYLHAFYWQLRAHFSTHFLKFLTFCGSAAHCPLPPADVFVSGNVSSLLCLWLSIWLSGRSEAARGDDAQVSAEKAQTSGMLDAEPAS